MIIFGIIYFAICFWGLKMSQKENGIITDFMSIDKTLSVKGIFVMLILIHHAFGFCPPQTITDTWLYEFKCFFGQLVVVMFMFYSGFGLMHSITKKGKSYIDTIPSNRVLKLICDMVLVVLLYLPFSIYTGQIHSVKQIALSFFGYSNVGNYNWYIYTIIWAYLLTYIAFKICKNRPYIAAVTVTVLCGIYIIVMHQAKPNEYYWCDTLICFPMGIWFSLLWEKHIKPLLTKHIAVWYLLFIPTLAVFLWVHSMSGRFIYAVLRAVFFCVVAVMITMKISFNNAVLRFFGRNIFGIYIFQKMFFVLFETLGIADISPALYFGLCAGCTIGITVVFNKISAYLNPMSKKFILYKS